MQVNELRIGNLFQDKYSKKIIPVLELLRNGNIVFDFECFGEWQAEPIILTEEWLDSEGFKRTLVHANGNGYRQSNWIKLDFSFQEYRDKNIKAYSFSGPLRDIEIKYVHQLQNLYFALTGEELICKS